MATIGVPTRDPLITTPYIDPDVGRYGEVPSAKELAIRVAATPAGTGALVTRRHSINQILQAERVGRTIDPASATASWTPSVGTVAAVATNPAGYAGTSLQFTPGALAAAGSANVVKNLGAVVPLSFLYSGGTHFRIWARLSVLIASQTLRLQFGSGAVWSVVYDLGVLTAGYVELLVAKGATPVSSTGTPWSSDPTYVALVIVNGTAGAASPVVLVRDIRVGVAQTDGSPVTGHLAWESSYDLRARYRDDATAKASTTLAAASAAAATNVKVTAITNLAVGDELTLVTGSAGGFTETRTISAVGTAGAGGTGVTVSEAYLYAHASGDVAEVRYWGPWSAWATIKAAQPPTGTASSPADAAVVTDPTLDLVHTFSSPGGKAQARRVTRVYERVGGVDQLIYTLPANGAGLTDTLPRFLLYRTAPATFAWEKDVYDTDGVMATTARRTFTTNFTQPIPVTGLVGTNDPDSGTATLSWTAYVGADFDHYRVYWRDGAGNRVRLDGGPETLDDGKPPLTVPTFTHGGGARLGSNDYEVTVHTGALESDSAFVTVVLGSMRPGAWQLVTEGDDRYSFPFDAESASRTPNPIITTLRPPGRGSPVHIDLGLGGDHVTLRLHYIPSEDGDLSRLLKEMLANRTVSWLMAPEPYLWDAMHCRVVDLSGSPAEGGHSTVDVELDEVRA